MLLLRSCLRRNDNETRTRAERILQGQKFSEVLAKAAGEAAMADARALRNNEYKIELAKALIRQALRMTVGSGSRAP
jgi:CO/xanthine dehydrogenase FAD-binding subunit